MKSALYKTRIHRLQSVNGAIETHKLDQECLKDIMKKIGTDRYPQGDSERWGQRCLALINDHRIRNGYSALTWC